MTPHDSSHAAEPQVSHTALDDPVATRLQPSLIPRQSGTRSEPDDTVRVTVTRGPDRHVVAVSGEIDMATAPQMYRALRPLLGGRNHVVVDLADVTFMDASALGVLVAARRELARSGGSLDILPNAMCARLMRLTGTARLLDS